MATIDELRDEERRVRRVRFIIDFTSTVIMQGAMARSEGQSLVEAARARVLELFPGREETFELLYARRFRRLLDEFTRPDPVGPATVIPFPGSSRS